MRAIAAVLSLALLPACGGDVTLRYDLPPVPETGKIPVSVASVEVREAQLPLYATQEVIYVETADGGIVGSSELLWADDPRRDFTEGLALQLATMTRAKVAAEPWPFYDPPQVRVEVRLARALPGRDGVYRIQGQYFVASSDGRRRDIARRFALQAPYAAMDTASIAAAKARLIRELATLIARDGL